TQDGKVREGKPIDKSLVYKLLNNRTYLGELRHKEQWYPAEHPPIIDRELWDQAHAILAPNGETAPVRPWDMTPTPLQLALARGHRWLAMLESGEATSLKEIAAREEIDNSYVSRMVNLTTLAPDIV